MRVSRGGWGGRGGHTFALLKFSLNRRVTSLCLEWFGDQMCSYEQCSKYFRVYKIAAGRMFRWQTVKNFIWTKTTFENVCHAVVSCGRKILTYIEYRTVSGVFRTIDPPTPPLHLASVSSPRTKGGGYTLAERWGGGGSIFRYFRRRQTLDWPLTVQYNPSTAAVHKICMRVCLLWT